MRGRTWIFVGRLLLAGVAASVVGVLLLSCQSNGAPEDTTGESQTTIDGGTWEFLTASTGNTVDIQLTGLPSEGLGAWDIEVAFDSAILNITGCTTDPLLGACNPNAPGGPARAAGFSAPGITTQPVFIASFTFDCVGAGGGSALTITVNELVDGTPGDPQNIPATVQDGTVVCGEAATSTPAVTPTSTPVP